MAGRRKTVGEMTFLGIVVRIAILIVCLKYVIPAIIIVITSYLM